MTATQILAAFGLLACLALLAWPWVGAQRQRRLRHWGWLQRSRLRLAWMQWRERRRRPAATTRRQAAASRDEALREATDLIERARRRAGRGGGNGGGDGRGNEGGEPDGHRPGGDNVIRPTQFGRRRRDLH